MGYAGGMSTFDPGLEPPGDWQSPYAPTPPPPNQAGGRAAVYLWLSAALQLVMSGCCGLAGLGFMFMSSAQIMENLPDDLPNHDEVLAATHYAGPVLMIASVVFVFIPALTLIILAFWVRSAGRASTIMSLIILGIQSAVLSLLILNYLFILLTIPSAAILVFIVVLTSILVLFIKTCWELIGALRRPTPAYPSEDGW